MKTIEEKAKAYDEAIKKAAALYKASEPMSGCNVIIETLFPELKESEGEKVRKEIIAVFKGEISYTSEEDAQKYIAWLEKQGEQKPILDFKAKDWYVSEVDGKIHNIYHSVDKVEPKFKVGDWIINPRTGLIKHIKNVLLCDNNGNYEFESSSMSIDSVDNSFHLWTIQDAKDGDVLISDYEGGICIAILKSVVSSNEIIEIYCHLINSELFIAQSGFSNAIWHPATKEQRDLLFQKMKEAGYAFDFEKKELKKLK